MASVEYRYDAEIFADVAELNDTKVTTARASNLDYLDTSVASRASQTSVDDLPTLTEVEASTVLAKQTSLDDMTSTLDGVEETVGLIQLNVDALYDGGTTNTNIAAIKASTDNLPIDPADQSAVEAAITASTTSIKGASNKDISQVYSHIDDVADAFVLDKMTTRANSAVSLIDATWVELFSETTTKNLKITGIKISHPAGNPVGPVFRLTADGAKIFPYGESDDVIAGRLSEWQFEQRVPLGTVLRVEEKVTTANSKTGRLDELDVIECG